MESFHKTTLKVNKMLFGVDNPRQEVHKALIVVENHIFDLRCSPLDFGMQF